MLGGIARSAIREVFFMTEGIIALIVFVYENLGYIVEIVEIVETGKKIIQIFTDDDGDGEPDTPELPFFEIDPEEQTAVEKSIIIMNSDGTMTIYDEGGNITAEDCDTAYSLWVSENGIMDKQMDNYSVTEGMLFLLVLISAAHFIRGLFKRSVIK